MTRHRPPSGLRRGLQLIIDPDWSPEQALAVMELLDDLRDRIWTHYELALVRKIREERVSHNDLPRTDPPF